MNSQHVPPIVVISLIDSLDRRAHISHQMRQLNVPFRFFDAERVRDYPAQYDATARLRQYGSHLTLGEVGCYDSHYQLWVALAASSDSAWCVLEDDVVLKNDFVSTVQQLQSLALNWGVVRLIERGSTGPWKVGSLNDGRNINDHLKQPGGTQGYIIRRAAAKVLVEYAQRMVHPVDDMLNRTWEHGLRMFSVSPGVIDDHGDWATTIGGRTKAQRTMRQKLNREFYTGKDSLNRNLDSWRRRLLNHTFNA